MPDLANLSPDARGISDAEYQERLFQRWLTETRERYTISREEWEMKHPAKTSRDQYGWRGMTGTSWIGPQK